MKPSLFGAPRTRATPAGSFRPSVEPLEDRALPSFVAPLPHGGAVVPAQVKVLPPGSVSSGITLTGSAGGTWVARNVLPGAGPTQTLTGSASFRGLGTFELSGTLSTPGSIIPGARTHGTLQFTNASGSLTVQLVATSARPGSTVFRFTIVAGTGAFAGATGSGSATLVETILLAAVRTKSLGSQTGGFTFTFA